MNPNTDIPIAEWQKVPERVQTLLPAAYALKLLHNKVASDTGLLQIASVSWFPEAATIVVSTPEPLTTRIKTAYANTLNAGCGIEFSQTVPDIGVAIAIKRANAHGVGKAWNTANNAIGGPTPLSNALVSGLLLGGLGYGAGTLAENVLPAQYFEPGRLRKPLGVAGLLAGLGIGHIGASGTARALNQGYMKSWVTSNNTEIPETAAAKVAFAPGLHTGLYAPTIPVDAFNRAVWADSSTGYNQTGIVPGHTSPQIAAATTGIMRGVASQTRSPIVSPANVINTLASAGVGLATANIAGRTLGALAGLTPAAQTKIQDAGLWAGMLHSVIPPVFGLN
jgi:hypothetical protein